METNYNSTIAIIRRRIDEMNNLLPRHYINKRTGNITSFSGSKSITEMSFIISKDEMRISAELAGMIQELDPVARLLFIEVQ